MTRKTTAGMKTKRLNFDLQSSIVTKSLDGSCVIEGFANTSSKDRVGDVVMPSAFEKSLDTYMKNPVLLANHDWNEPCGVVNDAKIVDKGLWIKATISETRQDIKTLVKEGCLRTFSIGYNELDADYDESTKTKYIKQLELLEISIVTVPANAEAMFTQVTAKAETEGAEKADDSAKSAPIERTAKELKDFIETVKSVLDRDLDSTEVAAISDYVINLKNEEIMNKEQLTAALTKAKSVEAAAAPAPAEQAKADAAPAQTEKPMDAAGMMKEVLAKLDAMAAALAQVLEGMQADQAEDAQEDQADQQDQKPQDQPAPDAAKPADAAKDLSDNEQLDEKELEATIAALESTIVSLEDKSDL